MTAVRTGIAGIAVALLPPLLPPVPPLPQPEIEERRGTRFATTGSDSELVRSVSIARRQGAADRVVLSLGPRRLPSLRAGDRLVVRAEVQVSTTCLFTGPRCVGRRYRFNPFVGARLVLAAGRERRRGLALAGRRQVHCTQRRPHRNHHCVLAFRDAGATIADLRELPCRPDRCWINLVLGANHPRARRGNRVVLGGDRPDGDIVQDKARLSAVIAREGAAPAVLASRRQRSGALDPSRDGRPRPGVVYSVELPSVDGGEVVAADASFDLAVDRLPYNAFVSSRLIIARGPNAVEPRGIATRISSSDGHLTESNGFNCTRGPSGYRTPCRAEKAGAARIIPAVVDSLRRRPRLYVNLVARAKPLLAKPRRAHRAPVRGAPGRLRVLRYAP